MIFGFILSVTMAIALFVYLVIATTPPDTEESHALKKEVSQPRRVLER
jgi:hypothetical protein